MLSIGTMAALCGTSVQTLRLYDKKGLLPAARIDPDSGYRYYTNGQIFLFQTIRLLQRTGMSLAEIRETLQKDPVDLRSLWDSQEKAILQKQQELHEMEIMVHQQQKQLEEASLMQQHAGKGPYIKRVSSTLLSLPIEKEGITPKVEPNDAVSLLSLHIIPALSYGSHVFSSNPAKRAVMLNGREFREGSEVASGVTLIAIAQDYIILQVAGQNASLKALQDWRG